MRTDQADPVEREVVDHALERRALLWTGTSATARARRTRWSDAL
ncbi:MAG: hypothetical protein Q8R60_17445 [Mycobacteriales bacterium]|nr:hypothetical protein [Mycobacteriales bacterium]